MIELGELKALLDQLPGQPCWSVIAGEGTGSVIHLAFGAAVPRDRRLHNPHLTAIQNECEGEFSLLVECAWRLEEGDAVVCGSTDDDRNDGPMVSGLARLVDTVVTSIDMAQPVPDVVLHFTGDRRLRVFCDQTNLETGYQNYMVRSRELIIAVEARGALSVEVRAPR